MIGHVDVNSLEDFIALYGEAACLSKVASFARYQEFLITGVIRKLLLSGKSVSPLRAVDEEGCA